MKKLAVVIATWFGSGLIPPPKFMGGMAGTYGSFFALPLCWWLVESVNSVPPGSVERVWLNWTYALWVGLIFVLGLASVPTAEKNLGPHRDYKGKVRSRDQNQIVIDEVLGMLIACWPMTWPGAEHTWVEYTLAFVFFRLFDIVKVWPAKKFDRMKNAFGVMMDDVVAGTQAAVVLIIIMKLWPYIAYAMFA